MPKRIINRAKLVALLDLPAEHTTWLLDAFETLPPHACDRAIALQGFPTHVHKHFGQAALDDFNTFWQALNVPRSFGMIPAELTILGLLKMASYHVPPDTHPHDAIYLALHLMADDFAHHNPLMQIVYRAAGDDLFDFIRMQVQSLGNWQNYGSATTQEVNPHHLCVHFEDQPITLKVPIIKALFESALCLFERPATVDVETHSPMSFTIHLRRT